jgi:phytoene synthase
MADDWARDAPRERATELAAHYAHCEALLREKDRDCWLACLFAPAQARRHLHALHAFTLEVAEVRAKVSQPLLGEMRLRWWTDALDAANGAGARANPIAGALFDTIERFSLPRAEAAALIDARVFDLYDDPMETMSMLLAYCRHTAVAPMRWAARILGAGDDDATKTALDGAGLALGLTKILRALPVHAAAGQCFIPADLLARHGASPADIRARLATAGVRAALADLRGEARQRHQSARSAARNMIHGQAAGQAALLPAAVVPLYLARMERKDYDPFRVPIDPPPWRRQWSLWRAARGAGL